MSLKKQALQGAVWTYLQQFGTQFITFVASIILARVLLPEEFGLIGMIAIFMGIGNTLFDGGMTSSLIRSENLDEVDYSTVFIFNLIVSIVIYCFVFLVAPYIADFYRQPALKDVTRVYTLSFLFSAFGSVQNTILTKSMNFKKQTLLAVPALITGCVVALFLAYNNYGVWSLVGMTLTNTFVLSTILWITSKWKPSFMFSKDKFKKHFNYGYKLTLSGVLDIIFTNIYQIVIGRFFSASLVGYYTRANQLMMMPVGNVSTALNKVAFPLFAEMQHDEERLRNAYKKIMLMVLFIICPAVMLMIVLAEPLTVFLFTDKWLPMVPIFKIICLSGFLYPLHMYNLLILQVKGRSDLFLKLEILKKILQVLVVGVSLQFSFYGLLWGQVVLSVLGLFINTYYAGRYLNYSLFQQLRDIFPLIVLSGLMGIATYVFNTMLFPNLGNFWKLFCGTSLGVFVYIIGASLSNFSSYYEIKKIILKV
jgi:teichuronic acid exporter